MTANLGYEVYKLGRLYTRYFVAVTRPIAQRTYPDHWIVLNRLYESDVMSQVELAPLIAADPGALTRTLTTMEARGWIARVRGGPDGRMIRVSLTAKGRKVRNKILTLARRNRPGLYVGIKNDDADQAQRVLSALQKNLLEAIAQAETAQRQGRKRPGTRSASPLPTADVTRQGHGGARSRAKRRDERDSASP